VPAPLSFIAVVTNPTTGVCNDGRITISASGGTSFYEYSIDNGLNWQFSNQFTGLTNGTYQAVVRTTDTTCVGTAQTLTLNNTDCPAATICNVVINTIDSTNIDCGQNDGTITVNATGSNLQYSIDNGSSFQASSLFENLASGPYTVIVRDAQSTTCQDTTTVNLEGTTLPNIMDVVISDTVDFFNNQGTITITATGDGSLQYSIDGGVNFSNNNVFNSLDVGTYAIVLANGDDSCPITYFNNPIQISSPCTINAGEDRTICPGAAISLSANGTGNTFSWTPATGLSCTDCANPIANPDTTTTYVLTNTGNGCSTTDTLVITVLPAITADFTFMTSCTDFSVDFMDNSATTGTIATYAWNFGDGNTSSLANPTHFYTTTGTYSVSLTTTTAGGCQNTRTQSVTVGNGLVGTVSADEVVCAGDCVSLMASGGTTYQWDASPYLSATNISNPVACPTQTTTY